jgi:hypothetical protein
MPSSYQVVLWKQERFLVLRPLQIEFFRNLLEEYKRNKDRYDDELRWAKADVRHWQDAYQPAAKGETIPDRVMSREEEGALYDNLDRIAKTTKNQDYVALKMGVSSCGREPRQFAYQMWEVFNKAHWKVPLDPKFSKRKSKH